MVGGDKLLVGFSVDSEVGSSFKFAATLLHIAEFRVYQGAGWVNETEGGDRVKGVREG